VPTAASSRTASISTDFNRWIAAARREIGWDDGRAHVLYPYDPARSVKNLPRTKRVVDAAADRVDGAVALDVVTDVPHRRMPTYLNAADALLLTSEHEGSPNTVKEALACNLPVVSTPSETCPNASTGFNRRRRPRPTMDLPRRSWPCSKRTDARTGVIASAN